MKNFLKNLIIFIGLSLLSTGISIAAPSSDCDDDVQPIKIQSSSQSLNKES